MAVYTSVNQSELEDFLEQYNLGKLISYDGILEGIENSNYKILMEEDDFILTIFEKRVDPQDLPFFMNLQKHLSNHGFHCPVPIETVLLKIEVSTSLTFSIKIQFFAP